MVLMSGLGEVWIYEKYIYFCVLKFEYRVSWFGKIRVYVLVVICIDVVDLVLVFK